MAETSDFVSSIKVRDLISAFESKSDSSIEFSRPRARSVGNVLAKNVVVKLSEFNTLSDVENALNKLDTNLNFYEVYNKAKHVGFQEQLFNILTSMAIIESNNEDAPARKKKLTTRIQTLFSLLNQKLPTNVNQVVQSPPQNQYKYTSYTSYAKKTDNEVNANENVKPRLVIYSENSKTIDSVDSAEMLVSVRKLKEHFLPKEETPVELKTQKSVKNDSTVKTKQPATSNGTKEEISKGELNDEVHEENISTSISVSKLRSIFENNSKGLELISDKEDEKQIARSAFGGSSTNISIPYTERNLGSIRLQRAVSGNYMDYVGLLNRVDIKKRTDINRSKSLHELNKTSEARVVTTQLQRKYESDSDNESGAVTDGTIEEDSDSVESVKELKINDSSEEKEESDERLANNTAEKIRLFEQIRAVEAKNSDTTLNKSEHNTEKKIETENVTTTKGFVETDVKYSKNADVHTSEQNIVLKNVNKSTIQGTEEREVNYSTVVEKQVPETTETAESTAIRTGIDEEDVTYSSVTTDELQELEESVVNNTAEKIKLFESIKEVDTNNSNIPHEENTHDSITTSESATLRGVGEEEVSYSTANLDAYNNVVDSEENVSTVQGTGEEDVKFSTAKSENIDDSEIATEEKDTQEASSPIDAADSIKENAETPEKLEDNVSNTEKLTNNDFSENTKESEENTTSDNNEYMSIEDQIIEEEIKKIDVDKTLANGDLVVNAEDLKNAEDEFEKLVEINEADKIKT